MPARFFVGVDPGAHGAIAVVDDAGAVKLVEDMPIFTARVGTRNRSLLNYVALGATFNNIAAQNADGRVLIEEVGPMPRDGVHSSFYFGGFFAAVQQAAASAGLSYQLVKPAKWKKALALGRDKNLSRAEAVRRFPSHAHLFARVKDDGRAEAILLADYARTLAAGQ